LNPRVVAIDSDIALNLKVKSAHVQGVYTSTIHLLLDGQLITVGHKVGHGKHHVVIDQVIDFYAYDINAGSIVSFIDHRIKIEKLEIDVDESSLRVYQPYTTTYRFDQQTLKTIQTLKEMIQSRHHHNVFSYPKNDPWLNYQFEKIDIFLHAPGLPSALSIMGLGMGLTPLGDDVITGFILGQNTVGKSLPWIEKLIEEAKRKTNLLSYQNLQDTYNRYYPDPFIAMIEGLFVEHNIEKATAILKLGATSGAGILSGFIYGLLA